MKKKHACKGWTIEQNEQKFCYKKVRTMLSKGIAGKRKLAMFLATALALSSIEGSGLWIEEVWAAQEDMETENGEFLISTVEDLINFGQNCTTEVYSRGKTFVLAADLNLQGIEFQPIPVFAGTFDGGGHGIIGLSIHSSGSNLGLFRYIQEGATVKNLTVDGTLTPEGSRTNVGGIVGTNRGFIENCSFAGQITAQEAMGGIAGYNEETGIISKCQNQAVLTGNLKTGGIAGYNEGVIEDCINKGEINTTGQGVAEDSSTQLSLGNIGLEEGIKVERVNDTGGIAGLSFGTVRNCTNFGGVGYPHMGYNMGGIVGRQNGLVDQCVNYGQIRGRKDVGGIVGQFEPYLSVIYEEDMFGDLENQMEELSNMGDSLSGMIEQAGDTASNNLDQIDAQIDQMKDIGRFYKDLYRTGGDDFDRQVDQSIEEIEDVLDHTNLDLASRETEARYWSAKEKTRQIKNLRAEMEKGYEGDISDIQSLKLWLQKRLQQMEQLATYTKELQEDLAYLALYAPGDMVGGVEDFGNDIENLQTEASMLSDIIRINADKARNDLHSLDEEMTGQADLLSSDIDTLSNDLKNSRAQIRNQKDQIVNQIDQIRGTITDGIDRAKEEKELFEDVSDLDGEGLGEGMVNACINQGVVLADYQAGGIVGIIGLETSLDPERDLEVEEERTLNVTRNIRAIVLDCKNQDEITVTNDYVGGIAGKANLGALIQNQNYGDIVAEDGNYAGGITGSSANVLRRNYNMCTIDGNNYVGGIAGWGTDILDNYAMVSFGNLEGEWIGTVAGDTDKEGIIQGNFYVDEGIGALDGITYENQAQGLSYDSFRAMEQMPEEFGTLTVSFLVEDQVLKTVFCEYGDSIQEEDIPQVPQKDGYYYEWEEKDLSCVKGNQKIRAIYKAWNTTIASSEDKMPVLLAEANFYPGTTLVLEKQGKTDENTAGILQTLEDFEIGNMYEYTIIQPKGVPLPEKMIVHVLAESYGKGSVVGIVETGEIRMINSRWDGAYLVFEMNGPGAFVILKPVKEMSIWIILTGGVVVFAGVWLAISKRKKKKKQAAVSEIQEQETSVKEQMDTEEAKEISKEQGEIEIEKREEQEIISQEDKKLEKEV